jgi:hypothetical protein
MVVPRLKALSYEDALVATDKAKVGVLLHAVDDHVHFS